MKKEAQMTIPHLFRCPISLDLFTDPVTLCTGQTYDRSSIEKWLAAGNLTCPVTMQKLHDTTLVPNHTLRHLINQWLQIGGGGGHHHHQFDPDYLSLAALKHNLESHEATIEEKLQTLENILIISKESSSPSTCFLIQLRFLPSLLEQIFGKSESNKFGAVYVKFVEQTLSCILRLLRVGDQYECLNMLIEESKFEYFLVLFKHGSTMTKKLLCHLIEVISTSPETKQLCSVLGKDHRLLRGIVSLIHQNSEASDSGIKALSALCSSEMNLENLIRQGVIDGLVAYILNAQRSERRSLAPIAMARIEQLLVLESAREELINHPNGVNALVKMVFTVSDHEASESSIKSLMIICCDSLKAREEAMSNGVLTQLLLLLQSQCSNRTKTKARMLLKLLRSKWVEEQTRHV